MLILTEKPSVAAAFASALGVPRKGTFWENDSHCIVNALGHLLENFSPEDYDPSYKKWKLEDLPIIPQKITFKPIEKTLSQLEIVKKCFASHKNDPFLLATDAEREGELIGDEILVYTAFSNFKNSKRFWVSEALTKEVILKGIKNAKPLDEYASYKNQGYARQEADWLIGMNLSRLLSLKAGKLLTIGRVQTAILAAVYERENEIASFSKQKYLELSASLRISPMGQAASGEDRNVSIKLINRDNSDFPFRFPETSPLIKEIIEKKDALKSGTVTSLQKEKKTVYPQKLLNLTALQKEAHKKFSYSPEQTLNIAQALYEKHKCMSYPRTPSRVMGDDNVDLVKGIYEKIKDFFPELSSGTLPDLISPNNKRVFNSAELQDHHALIPLSSIPSDATTEEKNVFSLVLKSFFGVFKPPYVYNAVTVDVDIGSYLFRGNGSEILERGWKTEKDDDEEPEDDYSSLALNSKYPVVSIAPETKFTEPKKHHTYGTLLQLMENPRGEDGKHLAGLGTPATRGNILQKLFDRNYLSLQGKNILISRDGSFLIENVLKNEELKNFISIPETTRWEERLHDDTSSFISGIKDFIRNAVSSTSVDVYKSEKTSLGKCPLCGGDIYEGKKNYYCGNYKEKECAFVIWKETLGASVSPSDVKTLLLGKKTKVKKCASKAGKDFEASFYLEKDKVKLSFPDKKK